MDLDEFCIYIKNKFPEASHKADVEYDKYWNSIVKMEFSSYSWFESLAKIINSEMNKGAAVDDYGSLFLYISKEYENGIPEIKNAIDVAFIENLFWQVSKNKCQKYWDIMPLNLQKLYLDFHKKIPF